MFRSFEGPTADHVWQHLVEAFRAGDGVLVQPSRGGVTKEFLHVAITVNDPRQRWVASRQPPLNVAFAIAEVVWIITGRNDLAFLEPWNRRLPDYVGKGPKLHGAYGHRLRNHVGVDQLTSAYQALSSNPDTRQAVLQIWDSSIDLPQPNGTPANQDIPCNVLSLLKVRAGKLEWLQIIRSNDLFLDLPQPNGTPANQDIPCNVLSLLKVRAGKLEWLQIIRSNDLFLGVPHNFVQFMCLQEVMAGWLGVDCGAYHQVSDSLHLYDHDEERVFASAPLPALPPSTDSLALPKEASEAAFEELGQRIERMIAPSIRREQLERIADWDEGPEAFRNMLAVLASEAARRHKWPAISERAMVACTNSLYNELWRRWLERVGT